MQLIKNFIRIIVLVLATLILLTGCTAESKEEPMAEYKSVSSQEAKELMDSEDSYIILDVRTEEEYAEGHIKNAVLIPDYEIAERAEKELTDKNQLILVYCRSGRRSKIASDILVSLDYTNVVEFGGIIDWQYDIEK